ncbi:hypothetical protein BVY01_02560 [bacterium I07]|nr:hypothetical protein BVY01_02560 [bacterium I07]
MKAACWILLLVTIFYTSCSKPYLVRPNGSSYDEVNRNLSRYEGTITLSNGEIVRGIDLFVKSDSISWTDVSSQNHHINAFSEIKEIRIKNRKKGSERGAFLGASVGLISGFTFYLNYPSRAEPPKDPSWRCLHETDKLMEGSIATAVLIASGPAGALIGFLLGLDGITERYIIADAESELVETAERTKDRVMVISERVGESIEREEWERYKLSSMFVDKGFKSATLFQKGDQLIMKIVNMDQNSGEEKVLWINTIEEQVYQIRTLIEEN